MGYAEGVDAGSATYENWPRSPGTVTLCCAPRATRDLPSGLAPNAMADSNTLICSLELNKTNDGSGGATIIIQNDQAKITQTIHMDGTTLTIKVQDQQNNTTSTITQTGAQFIQEVKGPQETSTITQVQDTITVKVKNFTVDAETVLVKSSKDSTYQAQGKFNATSTQDMTVSSSAKYSLSSTQAMSLSSNDKLSTSSMMDTSISATQNATISANMKLALSGQTEADLSALQVKITGQAQAELAAPMTKVGQSMTTISGQLIQLQGSMIQVG